MEDMDIIAVSTEKRLLECKHLEGIEVENFGASIRGSRDLISPFNSLTFSRT